MLRDLGIDGSDADESVYRFLIAHAAASEPDLARALGLPLADATAAVRHLRDLGLVVPDRADALSVDSTPRWRASAPELVLGPMLTRSRDRLRRAEDALLELVEAYRHDSAGAAASDLVEIIEGRAAQAHRLTQLEQGARRSIDVFQSGQNLIAPVADSIYDDEPAPAASARGGSSADDAAGTAFDPLEPHDGTGPAREDVHYRVVVDSGFLTEPEAIHALDERLAGGHEVRIVDEPLIKLVIVDGEFAMMQVSGRTSVMLRRPLVVLGEQLFETTWRHARPYFRESAQLSADDRRILQLMLAGLTDAAAASQLGTSPRTIQRRLSALMARAEVTTRMQLGWHAMRNNWI
jgi:DNA-binding CsgD family transcriptional regulator